MKRIIKILLRLLAVWLLFLAASLLIPPLLHRKAEEQTGNASTWEKAVPENVPSPERAPGAKSSAGKERVFNIETNKEALLWRLRLIEAARESLTLVTFDFCDDNSGQDIMSALFHAADRGVKIRILVDGINGMLKLWSSGHFQALAAHENVEARLYNPVNLLVPWKINYRLHDKYLIADDFAYILGGRNTNDLFLGDYVETYNEDRDILVYSSAAGEGNSYGELSQYFEKTWALDCCKKYRGLSLGNDRKESVSDLEAHYRTLPELYPEAFTAPDWEAVTTQVRSVSLYSGSVEPENKAPELWKRMVKDMEGGTDILIQTPYIICSREMYRDLTDLTQKGKQVGIILNAVEIGSNPFGCTDYLNQKNKIQRTGVTSYEYFGAQAMHTKTILIDHSVSLVGSCNLDMRSIYLDTELMLYIDSPALNARLRAQTDTYLSKSRQILPDGTSQDGVNYHPADPGIAKKILYGILRVLTLPLRHVL